MSLPFSFGLFGLSLCLTLFAPSIFCANVWGRVSVFIIAHFSPLSTFFSKFAKVFRFGVFLRIMRTIPRVSCAHAYRMRVCTCYARIIVARFFGGGGCPLWARFFAPVLGGFFGLFWGYSLGLLWGCFGGVWV